jgi:hypothetical protein
MGKVNYDAFRQAYGFLEEYQEKELQALQVHFLSCHFVLFRFIDSVAAQRSGPVRVLRTGGFFFFSFVHTYLCPWV